MEITSLLPLPSQPSLALYIIIPIVTLYCGLFLIIFNNYILRPKIQPFLQRLAISSTLFIQLFLDIVSNLSFITYAICGTFMVTLTDQPIRIMSMYCLFWGSLFMGITMYYVKNKIKTKSKSNNNSNNSNSNNNLQNEHNNNNNNNNNNNHQQNNQQQTQQSSKLTISKNAIILILCYINLLYHYFSNTFIISLPTVLLGLYILNIIINVYQQKYIQIISDLLGIKKLIKIKSKQKWIASLPSVQALAAAYPITDQEIYQEMGNIKKKTNFKETSKMGNSKIMGLSKLDTKIIAKQRLMKICLCVHLSMKKKQQEQIKNVRHFFGFANGTIGDQGTISTNRLNCLKRKTYFNNRNKDKQFITRDKTKKTNKSQQIYKICNQNSQKTDIKLMTEHNYPQQQIYNEIVQPQSLLFYIFPIRIFQSSKIITAIFGIGSNLAYGFLLNYCQNLLNTLQYGRYCQILIAAMLLPIIPQISCLQYFNTMVLSSIWKFGFCGLLWTFAILSNFNSNDQSSLNFKWIITPYLQYQIIIQLIIFIIVMGMVMLQKNMWKSVIGLGVIGFGCNLWVIYLSIANN